MFKSLEYTDKIITQGENYALDNRMKYKKYYQKIEDFAAENDLLLGGNLSGYSLLDLNVDLVSLKLPYYKFYSNDAAGDSERLTNQLYLMDKNVIVMRRTKIYNMIYEIYVDTRNFVTIYQLGKHKGVSTGNIIFPVNITSPICNKSLLSIPAEVILIYIYSNLYNPAKVKEWEELVMLEKGLKDVLFDNITEHVNKIIKGGGRTSKEKPSWKKQIYTKLIEDYILGENIALLNPYTKRSIQVISGNNIEREVEKIKDLLRPMYVDVSYSYNHLKLLTDSRLVKYVIYGHYKGIKIPILEIYNVAEHSIIPTLTVSKYNNITSSTLSYSNVQFPLSCKICTIWPLMQFLLIDLWTIQLLYKIGLFNLQAMMDLFGGIIENLKQINHDLEKFNQLEKNPAGFIDELNPTEITDYIGKYSNLEIHYKHITILKPGEKKVLINYYPAKNKLLK
jgi:hypothetical protein